MSRDHMTQMYQAAMALIDGEFPMTEPDANGWMPIETAAHDHFPKLVWSPRFGQIVAFLDATWTWWPIPPERRLKQKPTHWQPLAKRPVQP